MSYGMSDVTDERKVQALEAQASDIDKVAGDLERVQPSAALALKAQSTDLRQAATAFREATGLPSAGSWSLGTKIGLGFGIAVALGFCYGRNKK